MSEEKEEELKYLLNQDGLDKTSVHRVKDLAFDSGFECAFNYLKREWNNAPDYESFENILFNK